MTNVTNRQSALNEGVVEALTAVTVAITGFLALLVFAI